MAESTATAGRSRIDSIDILRGVVMVIMALDHVRDFFHKVVVEAGSELATGPTDLNTTTPVLFFTRWITHFCAPIFVFLAGSSAYLLGLKKSKRELSSFLIKRGIWLLIVEMVIITLGWTFNPLYNVFILQVIWAIGWSLVILGLLVYLPFKIIFIIGIIIVFGHNLLDYPAISKELKGGWLPDMLYFAQFSFYNVFGDHFILIVYAFLPWTGLMLLGYCFGKLFRPGADPVRRKKILWQLGAGLLLLFTVLRLINHYGDPVPWSAHPRGAVFTFLSFININKYPPSLDFLCVTIGGGMLMLALLEGKRNTITNFFRVYGRVPMFYYILHFYLIHLLVVIGFFQQGYSTSQIVSPDTPFLFRPNDFGYNLGIVYLVWILVVLLLYPLCKKYDRYKTANAGRKWWLSYL
jgi:uncharacterized membrane protein